jgi:hypothetical protein
MKNKKVRTGQATASKSKELKSNQLLKEADIGKDMCRAMLDPLNFRGHTECTVKESFGLYFLHSKHNKTHISPFHLNKIYKLKLLFLTRT